MFTGIITNLGKLKSQKGPVLTFSADKTFCKKLDKGISIAINGACLTVFAKSSDTFSVEVMPETLDKTSFKYLRLNEPVNLELPLTPNSFLSGHIVQGHVDGVATLKSATRLENSYLLKFSFPKLLSRYIAEKGSITVSGISLTIIEVKKDYFTVGIIPYTWDNTMLHTLNKGNLVNMEVDILAKYIEKLLK